MRDAFAVSMSKESIKQTRDRSPASFHDSCKDAKKPKDNTTAESAKNSTSKSTGDKAGRRVQ